MAVPEDSPFAATWAAYEVNGLAGDLAALEFGMEMERRIYRLYREAAAQTKDTLGRRAYEFLMEENRHFKLLQEAHSFLSDNKHRWDDWEHPFFEG
ncbi:MAG TPA: hypothetical protein EYP09_07770 [Anaerolineae bacterium]|nr:hypothetical protein [Anaerolineae bacterium]